MRVIEGFGETTRHVMDVHQSEQGTQAKIVQHYNPGVPLDQAQHMLVKLRITKVIENAVKFCPIGFKPVSVADCKFRRNPRICDLRLINDADNLVVTRQALEKVCAIIGNSGLRRWQRRYEGKSWSFCDECYESLCVLARRVQLFEGIDCFARALVPGKRLGSFKAPRLEALAKIRIG